MLNKIFNFSFHLQQMYLQNLLLLENISDFSSNTIHLKKNVPFLLLCTLITQLCISIKCPNIKQFWFNFNIQLALTFADFKVRVLPPNAAAPRLELYFLLN